MKKSVFSWAAALLMAACCLTACEKPVFDEDEATDNTSTTTPQTDNEANLTLRVADFTQVPYPQRTRALVDITGYSTRLNFVLYQDGKKVTSTDQLKDDNESWGQVQFTLKPGTYMLLVVAHSCKGNPTLASPEQVKFTNAIGYTDTFYYYNEIEVTSAPKTHDLTLSRATSLLQFIVRDEVPANVTKFHFLYTGGSGVLNATTGYGGEIDSRQERLYNIEGLEPPLVLPLYTFLQAENGKLNVTVTAQDADGQAVLQRKFTEIPVNRNMITEYAGVFFEHDSENSFTLRAETDWGGTYKYEY